MSTLLRYLLTPRTAISAGRGAQVGNTRAAYDIVPGTVVRGALAAAWFTNAVAGFGGPHPQRTFDALFGRAMTVGAAIPTLDGQSPVLVPMSAARCKYPRTEDCYRHWHDLVDDPEVHVCPGCGGKLASGRGWELPSGARDGAWLVSHTRTELEEGAAKKDALFTRQALRPTVTLSGTLIIDHHGQVDVPSDIASGIAWLKAKRHVSIGGQRSILGRCHWEATEVVEEPPSKAVPSSTSAPGIESTLAVRLAAPAILLDEFGAPSLDLRAEVHRILTSAGIEAEVTARHGWTRPLIVGGWHGVAGLPKPEEWALHPGSMVVVSTVDVAAAAAALAPGVGVRRNEGFGQVDSMLASQAQTDLDQRLKNAGVLSSWSSVAVADRAGMPPATVEPASGPESGPESGAESGPAPSSGSASAVTAPAPPTESVEVQPLPPDEPRVPNDPVSDFLGTLPEFVRSSVAKGLLAQARHLQRQRANRLPESLVLGALNRINDYRWMRELGANDQDTVVSLLRASEAELAGYLVVLESWQGGSR